MDRRSGMIALPGIIDAHLPVADGFAWLRARPVAGPTTPRSCAAQPLHGRRQFNSAYVGGFEMLSTAPRRRRLLPRHTQFGLRPRSIAALTETGIRHLFTYSFMPVLPDEFPRPEDRLTDGAASTTSSTIPRPHHHRLRHRVHRRPGLEKQLAFARDLMAPSCIHVNETAPSTAECRWPARTDLLAIHGNLIANGELELMAKARMPLCFTRPPTPGNAR